MIRIKNVSKKYKEVSVVHNLSLEIPKGSVFGFLGQNGAGKTTTIKMIVGLIKIDEGTIDIEGVPSSNAIIKEKIGFMPEAAYFYERLTGIEFLKFCGSLFHELPVADIYYEKILNEVGILEAKDLPIKDYSKGMKQRLSFAQAIINNPEYIFLDEPLDGLDPIGRREIKTIIKKLKSEGKTIFFNSHILYDTEELCEEIGVIH